MSRLKRFADSTPLPSLALRTFQLIVCLGWFQAPFSVAAAGERENLATYEEQIQPLLVEYCYDCHGYGASEGGLALDQVISSGTTLGTADLWWRVLRNLRAGVMPPPGSERMTDEEVQQVFDWIKFGPFAIDPRHPDPGPVTIRRLNRDEYGNTVRALMGIDFDEKLLFPPDDSGHGFDNVADALMVSPLLLEKYLTAAEEIVARAVPTVSKIVPRQDFSGRDFASDDGELNGRSLDGKRPATVLRSLQVPESGQYLVTIGIRQHGSFEFDPARYRFTCRIDGEERFSKELGWDENKRTEFRYQEHWEAGEHLISFELQPLVGTDDADELMDEDAGTHVRCEIDAVSVEGPQGTDRRVPPENYERFFSRDTPPRAPRQQRKYAREVLQRFASKAYRRAVDDTTLDRLVAIAEASYASPEHSFESGVAQAMVAVLASPRFLFRIESTQPDDSQLPFAPVDEYSLASRLSYFLWSSMPDDELLQLAEAGQLRSQIDEQVERMLRDPQADAFLSNFVGQWLRTRDVLQVAVDPAVVLGHAEELEELRQWFRSRFRQRGRNEGSERSEEDEAKIARYREIREIVDRFDDELKQSMRQETEQFVEYVLKNESMLDLLDCDYTFLNETLAEHYGIDGVTGAALQRVELPEDSPRGGILTQASMLVVTSNPTRTSPVKRGLFILDNILGTPAPPAPAAVPELEAATERFEGRQPSLRELLEAHRESDLCASCHARMDPLGLALENFDALGRWRDTEAGLPIEPQGVLVTGDSFEDISGLKKLLRAKYADDFYRCVTEKLMVFAIGRGIEYSDEHTLDLIVRQLADSGGRFPTLVKSIVHSAPFQMQRTGSQQSTQDRPSGTLDEGK